MATPDDASLRGKLRHLLRVSRFEGWDVESVEVEIVRLFRGGVDDQTGVTPDQPPGPAQ